MVARHRVSIPVPAPRVPFVRDWLTPALSKWGRFCYGGRRTYFFFGWLFWLWLVIQVAIFMLYFGVAAAMIALFMLTALVDASTYYWRRKAA